MELEEKKFVAKSDFIDTGDKMVIDFFQKDGKFDERAVKGGVYQIELRNDLGESIVLYIGESAWIIERCGQHLYALYDDPRYLGLTLDDLNNPSLILSFSVLNGIEGKKSVLGVGNYKEKELKYIKNNNPLTQLNTSDRQIPVEDKFNRVQDKMIKMRFK